MERMRGTSVYAEELQRVENPLGLTLNEEQPIHRLPFERASCTVWCSIWGGVFHKDLHEGERVRRRTGVAG